MYFYDVRGRMEAIVHMTGDAQQIVEDPALLDDDGYQNLTGTQVYAYFDYTLDAAGRRTGAQDHIYFEDHYWRTATLDWRYDGAGRLVHESYTGDGPYYNEQFAIEYAYDLLGNRVQKNMLDPATQQITSYVLYEYDADDQLLQETGYTGDPETSSYDGKVLYVYNDDPQATSAATTAANAHRLSFETAFGVGFVSGLFEGLLTYNGHPVYGSLVGSSILNLGNETYSRSPEKFTPTHLLWISTDVLTSVAGSAVFTKPAIQGLASR